MQGRPIELVFNLEKIEISKWEDSKTKNVIVLVSARGQMIHHRINRSFKHLSIIARVSVASESQPLDIVISQNSPAVRVWLKQHNVRFGIDFSFGKSFQTVYQYKTFRWLHFHSVPS
jgi:hypothetical protein